MSREIEKKYLIREEMVDYTKLAFFKLFPSINQLIKEVNKNGKRIRQGYLPLSMSQICAVLSGMELTFEVDEERLRGNKAKYYLTFKSKGGLTRSGLEKERPRILFEELWPQTTGKVL